MIISDPTSRTYKVYKKKKRKKNGTLFGGFCHCTSLVNKGRRHFQPVRIVPFKVSPERTQTWIFTDLYPHTYVCRSLTRLFWGSRPWPYCSEGMRIGIPLESRGPEESVSDLPEFHSQGSLWLSSTHRKIVGVLSSTWCWCRKTNNSVSVSGWVKVSLPSIWCVELPFLQFLKRLYKILVV